MRIFVQLQPNQFDFALKTRFANYLLTRFHIYGPMWNPRVMSNHVPSIHSTNGPHSNMHTWLSSDGVSWRTLMGYPSNVRNCACALPSPSPFHYVMAKIVPAKQLAVHAKSSTLYECPYGCNFKFFRLDGLILFRIIMGLRCELRYKKTGQADKSNLK